MYPLRILRSVALISVFRGNPRRVFDVTNLRQSRYSWTGFSGMMMMKFSCSLRFSWTSNTQVRGALPPFSLCTDWAAVDVEELSFLLAASGQNCELFPVISEEGSIRRPDPVKLRRALRNSTIVVAMYVKGSIPGRDYYVERPLQSEPVRDRQWLPWLSARRCLIAFGRATSDCALTACIHDLAVAPSLEKPEIGRWIVQRLVRKLVRRGIYDISVLARPEQREFFLSCGFGTDILGSTTMIYPSITQQPSIKI
ncbi:hypothetical protein O6H91_13G084300 [Diphasiastrum complanatum]|uniref:Uncharacterized protein n=1 Tax=Diphasiastrum complanatum TaxID=34168 RepID=A0ACC2BWP6_DIPCM|nr:hypothetical protein O6H91_13G084300 [Diphasiastrum complanatum]